MPVVFAPRPVITYRPPVMVAPRIAPPVVVVPPRPPVVVAPRPYVPMPLVIPHPVPMVVAPSAPVVATPVVSSGPSGFAIAGVVLAVALIGYVIWRSIR